MSKLPIWREGLPMFQPPYIIPAGRAIDKSVVQTQDGSTLGMFMEMVSEYDQPIFTIMRWTNETDEEGQEIIESVLVEPDTHLIVLAHPDQVIMNSLKTTSYDIPT